MPRTAATITLAALLACCAMPLQAQASPPTADPVLSSIRDGARHMRYVFTQGMSQMDEQDYAFRPTAEVRTFGQLLAHVALSNYEFCSAALGEETPATKIEQSGTEREDIMRVLTESFDYCDKAYAAMSDPVQAAAPRPFQGGQRTSLVVLNFRLYHGMLHWGNAVTYIRLRGKVPPSAG